MAGHLRARRWTLVACLVVIGVQAVLLATLLQGAREPHRVPVLVTAPAVVAHELAVEADALPGAPFAADWTDDPDEARAAVRDGTSVAAILVDLRETRDVLLVNPRHDPDLTDAVTDRLVAVEKARGRTLEVRPVVTSGADAAERIRRYVMLCGLLGFGYAVVVSLMRGPVAATTGRGVLRLLGLAAASVAGAGLLQLLPATRLPGDDLRVVGIGAAYVFMTGAVTLAVEALAGLVGIAAVAALYFVLATPLLAGTSHYLLPAPWPEVSPWTPTGSAQRALAAVAYLDPGRATQPALVVGAAAVVAVLVLVFSAQFRRPPRATSSTAMPRRHWRLWVVGSVLPLAVLMAVAVAYLPADVATAKRLPSVASETTCVDRAGRPRSVRDLNHQISTLQGTPAFQGADVGADVRLQDGRFLLVFGDTLRGPSFDGPSLARNSMLLWDTDCVSVVLPPSKGALIPDRLDGVGYWPMSSAVAHRPGYDLVLVSTQRVRSTGGGSFDFANLGPALAVFVVRAGGAPQLIATKDLGADDADPARPAWGAALAVDDGWVYAYGTARPGQDGVFGFSLHVARVRPDDVLDAAKWRFWDGSGWQRSPDRAAALVPAEGGVSQTLSVFHQGGRWYALSKRDGDLGDQLVFWTAPGPTGPFAPTDPVATIASDSAAGAVTYMPLAHPRILPERGTMVASYSRNNTDFDKIRADPTLYRPTFLRVPLPD
ncbi:DUF4185 domain-containing protein [Nocardioides sp. LMS-CY]|uniref:DUF4185 domain-containing protein n=1 Tax=Nocardioides sp. (strain LMS-CY) TaxID=2840457 RepID=UPI001C0020EB|nr:DUF4185 domain-containing protein [Nocardioides sp. LMS-CY]QWF21946.1 DUF4185 domain-containing protein [Nocardioides sp. LMS-CY]